MLDMSRMRKPFTAIDIEGGHSYHRTLKAAVRAVIRYKRPRPVEIYKGMDSKPCRVIED